MIVIGKCPTCGSNKIKRVRRKWTGKFHGQTYSVPRLEFHECPACGEKVYDREVMRKIEAQSPALTKARVSQLAIAPPYAYQRAYFLARTRTAHRRLKPNSHR